MTYLEQLRDLLSKIDAATGADRELDIRICAAMFGYEFRLGFLGTPVAIDKHGHTYGQFDVAQFTRSIDEALALVERKLPLDKGVAKDSPSSTGWSIFLYRGLTIDQWECCIRPHGGDGARCDHSTAPLAILGALFSALISLEESANGA